MIKRISINGQDLSDAVEEGIVISQGNRTYWRVMLQLAPHNRASEASGLLEERMDKDPEARASLNRARSEIAA